MLAQKNRGAEGKGMKRFKVDLNADIGESYGAWKMGMDADVVKYISSANIACGWHAGDPVTMDKTVAMAKAQGVAIGAHTGYPDILGFGRRNMTVSPDEIKAYVKYQLGAFYAFAKTNGVEIQHVKPHGAMYNMAGKDIKQAVAIAEAIKEFDPGLILMGLAGSKLVEAAETVGLRSASEVFADRAYEEDGSLVARSKPGAMIHDEDEAITRVIGMITEGQLTAITGKVIPVRCESICVHGDNERAIEFVKKIRERLTAMDIEIGALK